MDCFSNVHHWIESTYFQVDFHNLLFHFNIDFHKLAFQHDIDFHNLVFHYNIDFYNLVFQFLIWKLGILHDYCVL